MDESLTLGADVETGDPVRLGLRERQQGTYIIGKPGTGKTTLIESMVVQDMEAGLGFCVLDPHGDLTDSILARVPANREHDVILLDLGDTSFPFGLNLFECRDLGDRSLSGRIAAQAVEVFEKLWGDSSWGPQLAQVLRNCAYTMVANQGYTLAEVRRLLLHDGFRAGLTASLSHPQVREFWELEYDPLPRREQQQLVRSTLNKIDEFLTPAILPIVGFGRTTVDFRRVMDEGKILLVKLPVGQLGAGPVGLVGSMIVAQVFNAALSRQDIAPDQRRQFNLYADEYHRFATPTFAELLSEARKYAVATTLAHQFRDQLDEANRGATLTAGNLIAFGVNGDDAEELAKQFDRTPPPPDVVGQRPKLTISQNPVEHLTRHGHENATVRKSVADWLQELVSSADTLSPQGYVEAWGIPGAAPADPLLAQRYCASKVALQDGVAAINSYLVSAMERRLRLPSANEVYALRDILVTLRAYVCLAPELEFYVESGSLRQRERTVQLPPDSVDALLQFLAGWLQHQDGSSTAHVGQTGIARGEAIAAAASEALRAARERFWKGGQNTNPSLRLFKDSRIEDSDRVDSELHRVVDFAWNLHLLGMALAKAPILVDSGQWEPIYDRPRSYADVEGEIASALVNLPKYHARTRLLDGNHVVQHDLRAPEYEDRSLSDEQAAMIKRIRDRTRERYCAPLADVLGWIAERQRGEPPPEAPSVARRVSL